MLPALTPCAPHAASSHRQRKNNALAHLRLLFPATIVLVLGIVSMASQFDLRLADAVYAWEGGHWAWRDITLTNLVLHRIGRDLVAAAWLAAVLAWVATWSRPQWRRLRRPLGVLAASVLLSTLLVAWIKSWSNMDCPWDLARYGGSRAYLDLFAARPLDMPHASCFPAGHASGGYAWLALYFFMLSVRPAWRWHGLAIGATLGLVFGVSQQLRGAHFLSHDLWTAALCWSVAVAVHALARQPLQPAGMPR
jgi:membrane-associated PAP2 superfamily phosphatase